MSTRACRLLLGLLPVEEETIDSALYQGGNLTVVGSGADTAELHALAATHPADAVLLSAKLPGLDATEVAELRSQGLRAVGLALTDEAATLLDHFDLDAIIRGTPDREQLIETLLGTSLTDGPPTSAAPTRPARPTPMPEREGSVLAVVGSKGTPGSSELAASFAALVARDWQLLLAELDGDGGELFLRLGVDPREGSLLGLARAAHANEPDLATLLPHWLVNAGHGWPTVLLNPPNPPADLIDATAPGMVDRLLTVLTQSFPLVLCDIGHRLRRAAEVDPAVRLHRDVLRAADAVIVVIGTRREQLHAGLAQLELLTEDLAIGPDRIRVVVNSQHGTGRGHHAKIAATVGDALAGRGLTVDAWLPFDDRAFHASARQGRPLALARPRGPYARAVAGLVATVLLPGIAQPAARKHRLQPTVRLAVEGEEVSLPWRR